MYLCRVDPRKMDKKTTSGRAELFKKYIKYAVLDKEAGKIDIYQFKKDVADRIKVSVRTLDRNPNYENDQFRVFFEPNVVLPQEKRKETRHSKSKK